MNKHSQNTPRSTKQWMNERLPKLVPVPPSWKYLETNGAVKTSRSWLSSTARSQKETEMIKSWNPLKSCRAPLNGIEKKKKHYPLGIVHSREFQDLDAPWNSFSKDNEESQPQNVMTHLFASTSRDYCSTFTPHVVLKITWQYLTQDNQLIITSPFLSYLAVLMRLC